MCGIFGIVGGAGCSLTGEALQRVVQALYRLSESRGKEAAGVAVRTSSAIEVFKSPRPASEMIRTPEFEGIFDKARNGMVAGESVALIGHSRLVTNGSQASYDNNQPVIGSDTVGVHNGIVVNVDDLWEQHADLERLTALDSEVILALLEKYQCEEQCGPVNALRKSFDQIEGMASVALLFAERDTLLLATNNGSIYFAASATAKLFVFASERYILETMLRQGALRDEWAMSAVRHLAPGREVAVSLNDARDEGFALDAGDDLPMANTTTRRAITAVRASEAETLPELPGATSAPAVLRHAAIDKAYEDCHGRVSHLRRCTRCVLPETIPFIEFDDEGVCNYCRHYVPVAPKGRDALEAELAKYRKGNGEPDCIVAFSGGRDSSYGLHYLVKEMGMTPLAYTYDWGMVTDLARRNQSRMCGNLGVEHILVSADIPRKRANIRRNVSAWLKQPDLGMVPLFMAGDKQFFYYANVISKQNNVNHIIFSENLLEKTYFKTGFCGIPPAFAIRNTYTLQLGAKLKLMSYYGSRYLRNPGYLNRSLIDTFGAYLSYYVIPHDFLWVFQYLPWDEQTLDDVLLGTYDWEIAVDTKTTWRIGDGTAPFYNTIYYVMGGFTENDTFRSNQVREGQLTREQALALVRRDNMPRFESMAWYFDVIGVDMESALHAIHKAPKLYD